MGKLNVDSISFSAIVQKPTSFEERDKYVIVPRTYLARQLSRVMPWPQSCSDADVRHLALAGGQPIRLLHPPHDRTKAHRIRR